MQAPELLLVSIRKQCWRLFFLKTCRRQKNGRRH